MILVYIALSDTVYFVFTIGEQVDPPTPGALLIANKVNRPLLTTTKKIWYNLLTDSKRNIFKYFPYNT